ncbi:MAG: phosphatase PAP2 family protein [Gammaproteobacteria bacterium]|nr:phosphatase PAP2 family protein [Gammaproteobacteria bacterium]
MTLIRDGGVDSVIVTFRPISSQRRLSRLWLLLLLLYPFTLLTAADSEQTGDGLRLLLPLAAAGKALSLRDREGANEFGRSFLATVASTYALKAAVNKERPNGDEGAFPSGHTAVAFSGAAFLHHRYGASWGVPAYLAATYVGWSRVEAEQHDEVDVVAAALLAIGIDNHFVSPYQKSEGSNPISVSLWPARGGGGLLKLSTWW